MADLISVAKGSFHSSIVINNHNHTVELGYNELSGTKAVKLYNREVSF
jgi:hypothetical protein